MLVLLGTLLTVGPGSAQTSPSTEPLRLQRIEGGITLDGRLDEPAWARLDTLPMIGYEPLGGAPPSEPTEFRVGYDDRYLYVGARLYSEDPRSVRVNTYTRDRWADDDRIEILIDGYNDNETGVVLSLNAAGIRMDGQVSHDAEFTYGFPINNTWDAAWDVATERTEEGWSAEVRIPFSSLRFQNRDGRVIMGLTVSRFIALKRETVTFPEIDPSWSLGSNKPSQAQDVELLGIVPTRPVYVSPYALGGVGRRFEGALPGDPAPVQRSQEAELGLDLRYALTDNLNLDLTVNPDFAQAEADAQQVNLDRFSLFFPENRRFFQERAGIFDFRTSQNNRLFHSRRIGIVDGQLVPIYGGGRLVGRIGGWDVGLLSMQTAAADLPSENFAVSRLRRQILNPFSFVGGMVTSRTDGHDTNVAYGVDGTLRLGGATYAVFNWAQSFENGEGGLRTATGRALIENRSRAGLGYQVALGRAGDSFRPGVGFVQRLDYREVSGEVRYGVLPGEGSSIQRVGPRFEGLYLVRDSDGQLETAQLTVGGQLESNVGFRVNGGVSMTREDLAEGFSIGEGADVPAGRYDFVSARTYISTPAARRLSGSVFARVGQYFDGTIASVSVSPDWRVSPHLLLGADLERSELRFPARDQRFVANIVRVRSTISLNRHLSTDLFVQYNSRAEAILGNVRMRYNVSEGRDLWLVYNETSNTVDERDGLILPTTQNRTFMLKYVHTFSF